MTIDEWWAEFSKRYSLDDADSLKEDFKRCWEVAYEEGFAEGLAEFNVC